MPGQRAKGQRLVPIPRSDEFIAILDRAYRQEGYDDRAKFIRAAVREKLQGLEYAVEMEEALAPDRTRPMA